MDQIIYLFRLASVLLFLGIRINNFVFSAVIHGVPPSHNFVGHNGLCNSTFLCDPQGLLECTAGVCQCESPSNQRYDPLFRKCLSTVGGHCTLRSPGLGEPTTNSSPTTLESSSLLTLPTRLCIGNAECIAVLGGNYTECQCMDGYMENSEGSCVPGIGSPCNYGPHECNPLGMIVCKNGKCECLDNLQVYDSEMKRCVSPAGTQCKFDTFQLGCVKNALCYPFYYWMPQKCICKPGYIQTINRTCVLDNIHERNEI